MTGEEEDTDVGFPGPEHHIAERSGPMAVAMVVLAAGAAVGGLVQIPHVTHVIDSFLEPTFEGSKLYHREIPDDLTVFGLALGTVLGLAGILVAWMIWGRRPEVAARVRERLAPVHQLFVNKWYFDELYDVAFVRPGAAVGRFAQATFERVFVDRTLVGGATGLVRAGSAAVRAAQSGLLRYYAALLVVGVTGVAFYFLMVST
jgi:NADH-quinone oxidoreductase subunit L